MFIKAKSKNISLTDEERLIEYLIAMSKNNNKPTVTTTTPKGIKSLEDFIKPKKETKTKKSRVFRKKSNK